MAGFKQHQTTPNNTKKTAKKTESMLTKITEVDED